MAGEEEYTSGEEPVATSDPTAKAPAEQTVDKARENFVSEWISRIEDAKAHWKDDFQRMRDCIQLAREGADSAWLKDDKYVVAITNRHINQSVAQLYAKNPTPVVERKRKLWYTVFDGSPEMAALAHQNAMTDPDAAEVVQEIQSAKIQIEQMDRMARTCEIVDEYYMSEQGRNYKVSLKHLIRMAKVTCVGYVKLGFQRILGDGPPSPDRDAEIADIRSKIERIEEIAAQAETDASMADDAAEIEELRASLKDLQEQGQVIVREGPVHAFLHPTQVIIDPECYHLRTLAGASWIAIEYDMKPARIKAAYDKDIGTSFKKYQDDKGETGSCAKVYEVYDKRNQFVFTVCAGFKDYLREPARPREYFDRFFPVFPLVFNETVHDPSDTKTSIFPPSDVWLARHAQQEYNRSRQGLREHRIAARPYWVAANGAIEKRDRDKFGHHDAHELIEMSVAASENFDIAKILQRGPTAPIDPNLYETESVFQDIQRTVGSQEANIGGVSGATATESSIAEESRSTALESNVDDLDEFLSELAKCRGQMYFRELSKETVLEIAGPGAVWPDVPQSREEISRDLVLDIKAGSSGRPNQAAKLANLERAMPFVIQFPGLNPEPLLRNYLDLLDINPEDAIAEGAPSIMALNALMSGQGGAQAPTGDPASDPGTQGAAGTQNAPAAAVSNEGGQPAYPDSV